MHVDRLDHLVLTVRDIEATCAFYADVLGMRVETFAGGRRALHFGSQKINLHEAGHEFEPKAINPTPGSADLCFISPLSMTEVVGHVVAMGAEIVEGPLRRDGAQGPIESVYIRDPDNNLIEISNYVD
jgi:catechol 2,3-dioxygenase-like lactoylglutathione lyase family enzyme